ncbi:winged helix-turn-helix domain-containing protein [Nocardioides sp. WL0053]|uniref:Winged helix-turn-helix domain-containing protein n=1 Tax=Nocardioides jiangsuensis TaxID=2866161 RepID=A0ABS7RNB6_9ACTN|nr:winged helix-turn-helix domain-containing protein [Nocardioides jiangsuensis]MBY9076549.1 winged helix-turn-helix domain-containing protein [Nocardioides jiangsuensis]
MEAGHQQAQVSAMRALAHPVRLRILSLLTGTAMSASEVARELGITQANASYHLRQLVAAHELVEAGEEKIRGGVAKRYRHPWERAEQHPHGAGAGRDHYLRALGEELVRRDRTRAPGTRNITTDAEMWVSPQVRDEVLELVTRAARLIHAEAQPPRTPGTVHVNLTAAVFEMADAPPDAGEPGEPAPARPDQADAHQPDADRPDQAETDR